MKKLLIILLSALSLTAVAQQNKVAVYVTGEQSGISKVLGDQLVAAFAKSGKYAAIERTASFLAELNKEHAYERSGTVNDNQIARLGVQFGVNYVCVADMIEAFGEQYISARLIDVETAEVVNTHNVSGQMNSMSTCVQMASEIATNLSKGSFAEQEHEKEVAEQKRKEEERLRAQQEYEQKQDLLRKQFGMGYIKLGSLYVTKSLDTASPRNWDYVKNWPQKCQIGGWNDWRFPTESEVQWIRYCLEGGNTTYGDVFVYLLHSQSKQYVDYTQQCIWTKNGSIATGIFNFCRDNIVKVILVRGYK